MHYQIQKNKTMSTIKFSIFICLLFCIGCNFKGNTHEGNVCSDSINVMLKVHVDNNVGYSRNNDVTYENSNLIRGTSIIVEFHSEMFMNEELYNEAEIKYVINCIGDKIESISDDNNINIVDLHPVFENFLRSNYCEGCEEDLNKQKGITISCGSGCAIVYNEISRDVKSFIDVDLIVSRTENGAKKIGEEVSYRIWYNKKQIIKVIKNNEMDNILDSLDEKMKTYFIKLI